jgi:hypothetical protein
MPGIQGIFASNAGVGRVTGNRCMARGAYSTASGNGSTASGYVSTASGNGSTASGNGSTASGNGSTASGNYSTASGYVSTASGNGSTASGYVSTASGNYSTASGFFSTASGNYSTASGLYSTASRYGQRAYASGLFAATGDAQNSGFVFRNSTTNATETELWLDGTSATAGALTVAATRTMAFAIRVAAHRTDVSGTAAAWPSITGGITRDATGNCRLLGTIAGSGATTMCDAGGSTWSVAVTADATNNRLAIKVTGEADKTIRWVATVDMAEVG